ncbi:MAG TPA: hypothetical protein VMV34_04235 [Terriglobia bacterium]|nr:hypothetical protein [Terriglobia bacterium]
MLVNAAKHLLLLQPPRPLSFRARERIKMADTNEAVYTSRVRIERQEGSMRLAYLPAEKEPVDFGVHSEVAQHYKVPPEKYPSRDLILSPSPSFRAN